jgi:ElaB/YqjD/DUF883 family membrane-anchored ribosome-binding protein
MSKTEVPNMTSAGNGLTDERYEAVKQDVKNLKTDASALANDSAALAGNMHSKATDTLNSSLRRIEDTLSEIWNSVSKTSTDSYQAVERNVEERPFTSIFAAFAAGCAVGWLLLDRKR